MPLIYRFARPRPSPLAVTYERLNDPGRSTHMKLFLPHRSHVTHCFLDVLHRCGARNHPCGKVLRSQAAASRGDIAVRNNGCINHIDARFDNPRLSSQVGAGRKVADQTELRQDEGSGRYCQSNGTMSSGNEILPRLPLFSRQTAARRGKNRARSRDRQHNSLAAHLLRIPLAAGARRRCTTFDSTPAAARQF